MEDICIKVIKDNQDLVKKIKAEKAKLVNMLMGKLMKETKSKADPVIARAILEKLVEPQDD